MSLVRPQIIALTLWFIGALLWIVLPRTETVDGCGLAFPGGMQIDAGELPAGTHAVSFEVRNDGDQVVRVEDITGSCTCMSIDFPGNQLMPGETKVCTVELNVQPDAALTGAVFLQTAAPVAERYALFIAYRGVQDDRLEVTSPLRLERLDPEQTVEFELECTWESSAEIPPDALVDWSLKEPKGIMLVEQRETREGPSTLKTVALFRAYAHRLSFVETHLEVSVGMPVRARLTRQIRIPVMESFRLDPDVVVITKREELERDLLARVQVERATGWQVDAVDAPAWLEAEFEGQQLSLRPIADPEKKRGIYEVKLTSSNTDGMKSERAVRIVLDMEI